MSIIITLLATMGAVCALYFIIGLCIKSYYNRGQNVTKDKHVAGFNKIDSRSIGTLRITQSDKDELQVQTNMKYAPRLHDSLQDSTLLLREKEDLLYNLFAWALPKPTYHVKVRSLKTLSIAGVGSVDMTKLTANNLTINGKGTGKLTANLTISGELKVTLSGNREAILNGVAQDQVINITGNSKYNGLNLTTQVATLKASGNSYAHVHANKTLDVTIEGNSKVKYSGNPQISRSGNKSNRLEVAE